MAGTIRASEILARIADQVQDDTFVRWTEAELMRWLSDAQREIVLRRPGALSVRATVALQQGTAQTIPAGGIKLLDVVRNQGVGGNTPGRAIRPVDRRIMDQQTPDWHMAPPDAVIKHFMLDDRAPDVFYVYPPALAGASVQMIYSVSPSAITSASQLMQIDDTWVSALVDFVLWRAYSKDADYAGNATRADTHRSAFEAAVSNRGSTEVKQSPNMELPIAQRAMQGA